MADAVRPMASVIRTVIPPLVYDFSAQLLDSQRKFAEDVLHLTARLTSACPGQFLLGRPGLARNCRSNPANPAQAAPPHPARHSEAWRPPGCTDQTHAPRADADPITPSPRQHRPAPNRVGRHVALVWAVACGEPAGRW